MGNLRNPQLQEVHTKKGDYLRYKGRDSKYHFLEKLEMPENDTNSVTWAQLKEMRDNALLDPGMLYRITDYQCTTSQADTRSAGHLFDVVVQALGPDTLSERAWAMPHDGDEYFQDSKLEAWQLWYCLDNDTSRFAWADAEDGKGVIWRMVDEWGNDCPYDFKNIQFKRWAVTGLSKGSDEMKAALIYDADDNPFYFGIYNSVYGDVVAPINAEIDDLTNWAWHYTFHGWRKAADGELTPYDKSSEQFTAPDEFKQWSAEEYEEAGTTDICKDNILGHNLDRNVMDNEGSSLYRDAAEELPNNVFMSMSYCYYDEEEGWSYSFDETYSNRLGDKCYNNTFGNGCYNNTFGSNCYSNTFGNSCYNNTFGNYCHDNTFGNYCQSNTFGNGCSYNTFGNDCYRNTFGNWFNQNTFGNGCSYNTFGNYCCYNTFGNGCHYNTFGNYCQSNTFGNYCQSNTFGNGCYNNTFGNNFYLNTFGNDCYRNTFGNNFEQSSIGDGVNNITVSKGYVKWIIIENGNQKITITSNKTTSSSQYIRNIAIALGVNNSSTVKTISHNTTNDTFKTTYQNANSEVVDV